MLPPNEWRFIPPTTEMPQTEKNKARSDKRERILSAAIQVFAQNGFYETRVSEIASAAGVADGTIYLYFKNKEDVLVSIFTDRISALIDLLKKIAAQPDSVEVRLQKIIETQLGLLEDQRDLAKVITVNLRQSSSLLEQYAAPLFTQYLDVMAEVIAVGQSSGELRADINPKIAARALWGGMDGIALTWALTDSKPGSLSKAASQFGTIFFDGLRVESER